MPDLARAVPFVLLAGLATQLASCTPDYRVKCVLPDIRGIPDVTTEKTADNGGYTPTEKPDRRVYLRLVCYLERG